MLGATKHRQLILSLSTVILGASGMSYFFGTLAPKELPTTSTTPLETVQPLKHDTRDSVMQAAWVDFAQIVGKENVSTNEDDLKSHAGSDWSSYNTKPGEKPFMVVYPNTTEEVSKIMKVCHKRKIPVTVIAGGTSLEGHFAPTRGGICLDVGRMDKILELHKADLDVVVQPALGWEDLNEELKEEGLFFPPDPGPGAKIGGMVGTGCSGTNAYRYGTMREWVVALTVVLADGTIIKTRQRPRKSSAGYDLTKMFIGSEGTLGIVTEAVLKVTVLPKATSVAVATFPNVHDAANCVAKVVGEGIQVAGVEILDDTQMRCINESGTTSRKWTVAPTLFFKFTGTPAGVKEQIAIVQKLAKSTKSKTFEFAKNNDEATELWSARKEALWSVMGMRRDDGDHVWTTDVVRREYFLFRCRDTNVYLQAVPMSRLPDIIQQTKDDISQAGLLAGMVGHVGDGNFHCKLLPILNQACLPPTNHC
jgi:D-lactate dehydrogenase (cytochrome)